MIDNARDLISRLRDEAIRSDWMDSVPTGKQGTAKAWFQSHHGATVDLLQAVVSETGELSQGWAPTGRVLDSKSRATYATFDGSIREYKDMRVEAVSDTVLVASSPYGSHRQIQIYRIK